MAAIEWVFFDVGDVLFDENAPHLLYFHSLLAAMRRHGVDVTWDAYHAQIIDCVKRTPGTAVTDAAQRFVPSAELWDKIYHEGRSVYETIRKPRPYGVLLNEMTAVLQALRPRFRLGIIANQHVEVLQAIDEYGITGLFDVRIIDQAVGVSKPDPGIFRLAFAEVRCAPEQAIMVGDRPDNDIAPANMLGMRTVRFRRGLLYNHYDPQTDAERANAEVTEISRLAETIVRVAT